MSSAIGTLSEGPLHAAIKHLLAAPGDRLEVPVGRYVIDLVRADGELVEVQTGPFGPLGRKLDALLDEHRIRVVHPIAVRRRIVRIDELGEVVSTRRAPRGAGALEIFDRLVSWPSLLGHPNLSLELLLCDEDHLRAPEPGRSRSGRRKRDPGERRLTAILDRTELREPSDALALLGPATLDGTFTTRLLAERLGCRRLLAQRIVYCLRAMELLAPDGHVAGAPRYRLVG